MEMTELQLSLRQEITDESIAAGNVQDSILLSVCDPYSFQYAVFDTQRNKIIALRDYRVHSGNDEFQPGFFQQIFAKDNLLAKIRPTKKYISFFPSCNVLVPGPLFSRENAIDFLNLSSSAPQVFSYHDKLRFADINLVYGLPGFLITEFESQLGEVSTHNALTAFIDQQLMNSKHNTNKMLAVNVRQNNMDIVVTDGASLLFSNTFVWQHAEDFIYYLLFTMEQLQMNPDQDEVTMFGEIDKTSATWLVSRKYIRNVNPGQRPEGAEYSYGFSKLGAHQYYSLFSQQLCVS
jgi:hypothetical protein